MKDFMKTKGGWILGLTIYQSVVNRWLQVWYVATFVKLVGEGAIQSARLIEPIIITIVGMLIVQKQIKKVEIPIMVLFLLMSYPSLLVLIYVGIDEFVIVSAITSIMTPFGNVFNNRINSMNIDVIPNDNERIVFRNKLSVSSNLGGICGAALAIMITFHGMPLVLVWLIWFVLMDISLATYLILIKKGIITY